MKTQKKLLSLLLLSIIATTTSCFCLGGSCNYKDVVQETFIHSYGVPVSKNDWEHRGKDGKVISLMKTGVTVTKSYSAGILHGETTFSFPYQDAIEKKLYYDENVLTKEVEYYLSGIPQKERIFLPDNKEKITLWYHDGSPQRIELYEKNTLQSGQYFTLLNDIESTIENGTGMCTRRNPLGELLSKDSYENSTLILRQLYYSNGEPKETLPFKNNLVHGEKYTYNSGGEPLTMERWVDGYQEGTSIVFQNGEKYAEVPYKASRRDGVERRFTGDERVIEEITWKEGRKHGPTKHFIADEVRTDWFFQGKPVANKYVFKEHSARS